MNWYQHDDTGHIVKRDDPPGARWRDITAEYTEGRTRFRAMLGCLGLIGAVTLAFWTGLLLAVFT